ncbi:EF-hand domain-containing protein [Halochromatium salexigens]|nr:EF-hand domain-containing protein [Halochromatium salexigens]
MPTFASFDADGDGQIDKEEFESAQMQHRNMMQP